MASKRIAALLIGLAAAALVLLGDAAFSAASRDGLNPFDLAELSTYDWRLTHTARPDTARQDIALVEIDERSLRNLQPNAGRWPWPRAVHSMLIDYLARAPAQAHRLRRRLRRAPTRARGFDFGDATLTGRRVGRGARRVGEGGRQRDPARRCSYDAEVTRRARSADAGFPLDVAGDLSSGAACCRRSTGLAAAGVGPRPQPVRARSGRPDSPHACHSSQTRHARRCRRSASRLRCASPASAPPDVRLDGTRLHYRRSRDAARLAPGADRRTA